MKLKVPARLERADVVIVGAGPAGSFLAYLLARAGCRVTIIDKATFPRDKVCGGGLSRKTVALLPFDISPVVHRRVRGAFLTYQNRDTVVKDLDDLAGAAVVRAEFDHFLLQQAIDAGARFSSDTPFTGIEHRGDGVTVTTGRGAFKARYVVGADGVFSAVRQSIFGRDLVAYVPAVEALVSVSLDQAARIGDRALFDFGGMPRGYGWIFPKKDHLNVGVFSIFRTRSINEDLATFMRRYDVLASPSRVTRLGFSIPIRNRRHEFERNHVLLVGDAAGFAESFYGEGIYFALKSARIAADALITAFERPQERAYTEMVTSVLQPELTYSELNARLFFPRQKFGFYRLVRSARISDDFAGLIVGSVSHRECFFKTLLTSPSWVFSRHLPAYGGWRL
jgi:geranylgeranyl reductase family protein